MFRIIALIFSIGYAYEDHEDDLWTLLFEDNKCQEAKWVLSNYDNDLRDGLEDTIRADLSWWCEDECGSGECDHFYAHDFENHDSCNRLVHGDLAERFENEVLHNPNEEERGSMMAVMNILCGHIEMECAYTMYREDQDECEDKCQHQFWNEGDDDYVYPCYFSDDHWKDDDHWDDDHWDDDHWDDDHWDDDHWDDDHGEGPLALWNTLMETSVDGCQEAKWLLSNYRNGFDDYEKDDDTERELVENCLDECGDDSCLYQLQPEDFVNHESCRRIKYGDLRELYENEVLNAPETGDRAGDRNAMMSLMNVMCGNMELECAYAAFKHWETVKDGRNIFEKLAEAVETPEKKECLEKCEGQEWDKGIDDMVEPCSSLMHSLSIAIILIISLLR